MTSWLYLYPDGLAAPDEHWPVACWQGAEEPLDMTLAEAARQLAGQAVQVMLPMEACSWLRSDTWPGRRRPSLQALAYSVEEQLATLFRSTTRRCPPLSVVGDRQGVFLQHRRVVKCSGRAACQCAGRRGSAAERTRLWRLVGRALAVGWRAVGAVGSLGVGAAQPAGAVAGRSLPAGSCAVGTGANAAGERAGYGPAPGCIPPYRGPAPLGVLAGGLVADGVRLVLELQPGPQPVP